MSIKFNCPKCRRPFNVKDQYAGKKAQCPDCKQIITVPAAAPAAAPASPPPDLEALAAAALADEPKPAAPVEQRTIEFTCYYCDALVKVGVDLAGKQTP